MRTWTVFLSEDAEQWEVWADTEFIINVRGHYAAYDVLSVAQSHAGYELHWRLNGAGGFISI